MNDFTARLGPLAAYPGNGNTTEPMAGLSALNGYEAGEACNTGAPAAAADARALATNRS
jgi:hypothetical protein